MFDTRIFIPTKEIVDELVNHRSTDLELMIKYGIPAAPSLYKVFNKLIRSGHITKADISKRLPEEFTVRTSDFTVNRAEPMELRTTPRNYLFCKVDIYDTATANPSRMQIEDISEYGLKIHPITTFKHDVREFMIRNLLLDDVKPFSFTAECCWTNGTRAGFKIKGISPEGAANLRMLIQMLGFEGFKDDV
jgi:hypothetical protein